MSQENVEVVLRLITAINEGDAGRALLDLHEDAEYFDHRASNHERFQGHEAFRDHFRRSGARPQIRTSWPTWLLTLTTE
jgi:ketosteroid isomerase-like protein